MQTKQQQIFSLFIRNSQTQGIMKDSIINTIIINTLQPQIHKCENLREEK